MSALFVFPLFLFLISESQAARANLALIPKSGLSLTWGCGVPCES